MGNVLKIDRSGGIGASAVAIRFAVEGSGDGVQVKLTVEFALLSWALLSWALLLLECSSIDRARFVAPVLSTRGHSRMNRTIGLNQP